jgi:endogenous inhibitor of DNA gyrase (YacG/DUF329 family)
MADEKKQESAGEVKQFRAKAGKCPICKKPALVEHRPFCSKRCAQIDLGRWLGEVYRAPADDEDWSETETWSADTSPRRDDR